MTSRCLLALLLTLPVWAQNAAPYPPPAFPNAGERVSKLKAAWPEVEKSLAQWAAQRGVAGMSYGLVIDGETVLLGALGLREVTARAAVESGTAFRIASMTKSFTSLAILKLRDEGKLSLDDEVARWIPEVGRFRYPTADTAPLRVRQLLTHSAGFPEDNPWGDQQLGRPAELMTKWLEQGLPWSTAPGTAYEYSNYGFALLGRIVERASGRAYREYVETEILKPLGMTHSTLEPAEAGAGAAVGYRREGREYRVEPSLAHGAFGAMGGLVTTAPDLAKYVAMHVNAWPPRDARETGPVRRSSVREMHQLWRWSGLTVNRSAAAGLTARATGYGYGLVVSSTCEFGHLVGHGGGLPGFGSYMLWAPELGVGLFAMTNLTYAGPAGALTEALQILRKTGALAPRAWPPSPVLTQTQQALFGLWKEWRQPEAERIAADNLFLDRAAAVRRGDLEALKKTVGGGECRLAGPVRAENWLRGAFDLECGNGGARVRMEFTLAPTTPEAKVQFWSAQAILPFSPAMQRQAERALAGKLPAQWKPRWEELQRGYGACRLGEALAGDGVRQGTAALTCERGRAQVTLRLSAAGRLEEFAVAKGPGEVCVP
ncbi:MAG: beta-lactamase family protein [Bryobacterales bacterium]|nr:beta-lactamase family protein [Bryobacterales bacterium]